MSFFWLFKIPSFLYQVYYSFISYSQSQFIKHPAKSVKSVTYYLNGPKNASLKTKKNVFALTISWFSRCSNQNSSPLFCQKKPTHFYLVINFDEYNKKFLKEQQSISQQYFGIILQEKYFEKKVLPLHIPLKLNHWMLKIRKTKAN